jgi:hypothetical protein
VVDELVVVHRYRSFDPQTGDWFVQLSKATEDYIRQIGGRIIQDTAEQLLPCQVDAQGRATPHGRQ